MQTILGSGGAIGTDLAASLATFTNDIRLVSRNPRKVNPTDTLHPADLSDPAQILNAVAGSSVCYLTIGFDYNTKLWQEKWLPLVKNVVNACAEQGAKLVFFDNVYAIGGDNVKHITETSPISPSSMKGEVRAMVDRHILESVEKGKITAIIARAPDFFGTAKERSLLMNLVYDNLVKGKTAQWFCNADVVHSTGYTPTLAEGTAILGNSTESDVWNSVWNLPVDSARLTGRDWTKLFAKELGKSDKVQVLPGWGMQALGLFVPILKEMYEMRYQYDREYFFDSSKFCIRFKYTPLPSAEAVRTTIAALK